MSKKIEEIGAYVAVAIVAITIAATFLGGTLYIVTHAKAIILHSDTGDYACTVSPLSHKPTNCKPITE